MKKLTRKHIIFLSLIGLFLVYLVFANSIVLSISSDNPPLRCVNTDDFLVTSSAFSYVTFEFRRDLFETFFLRGWAFAEADYQENKTVDLVLRGIYGNRFFSAPMSLSEHEWLHITFSEKRVGGTMHRIVGEFSAMPLPDDNYEVYLYIQENENEAGWSRPGIKFEVNDNRLITFNPKTRNFADVPFFDIFTSYVFDSIGIYNNMLYFQGWFAPHGHDTLFQDIWIELTNTNGDIQTFRTLNIMREDVAVHFADPLLQYSGFHVDIPMEYLSDWEDFTVMLIVSNNGNLARHEVSTEFNLDALR